MESWTVHASLPESILCQLLCSFQSVVQVQCGQSPCAGQQCHYQSDQVLVIPGLLIKPSELVLYRGTEVGGLGLMNVSMRSLALLIRSFLETSINPNFRHSLLHEHLYHVMGEHSLPDPGFAPYDDKDFFQLIQQYKTSSTMNIATMSIKECYTLLLEDKVLMSPADDVSPAALLPVRAEVLHPNTDWTQVWQIARTKGLGSELISFQFKLMHNLLPTQERIDRLGLNEDQPRLCLHCSLETENLVHSLFDCTKKNLGWPSTA